MRVISVRTGSALNLGPSYGKRSNFFINEGLSLDTDF